MFNFIGKVFGFKKIDHTINKPEISGVAIVYSIAENKEVTIDIELKDYSPKCIQLLCKLLDAMSSDSCYVETIDMIKHGLIKDGQEKILLYVLTHVGQQAMSKLIHKQQERTKNEPCIKPSSML